MPDTVYTNITEERIGEVAQAVLDRISKENINTVLLYGRLGAGKTALTKRIARHIGVVNPVQSPTFVIMKEYNLPNNRYGFSKMAHIDAYRLKSAEDLRVFNLYDLLKDSELLTIIEWPERFGDLDKHSAHMKVRIDVNPDDTRNIEITKT